MLKKKMHEIVDSNFNESVKTLQSLVKMDSVLEEDKMTVKDPFGEKLTKVLDAFLNRCKDLGFTVKNVDNAAGHAECGKGEEIIGILCHLDVVPTGKRESWMMDPFSGEVVDNKLYGRGSIDDKGPTVASLYALKALLDCGVTFNKRFRLIVGLDEETGFSRCLKQYLKVEATPDFSFSPDARFPVINAEKGIMRFTIGKKGFKSSKGDITLEKVISGDRFNVVPDEAIAYFSGNHDKIKKELEKYASKEMIIGEADNLVTLTAKGVSVHAMDPDKGKNALQALLGVLVEMNIDNSELIQGLQTLQALVKKETDGKSLGIACQDDVSGKLTCNVAAIKADQTEFSVKFDVRYPVTVDGQEIVKKLEEVCKKNNLDLNIPQHRPPLYVPESMPFIQVLLSAYNDYTGDKGKAMSIGGGTYCRNLPNAVSFGALFPEETELAHQPNENFPLDAFRKVTHIFAEALYRLNEAKL